MAGVALQNLSTLCVNLVITPNQICVTMPGGNTVCAQLPTVNFGTPLELIKQLLSQVDAALAPYGPIFNIIDVVQAIGNCMESLQKFFVGDVRSFPPVPPLSPGAAVDFIQCLPELLKKLNVLLGLIPQLSLPLMLAQVLDAIIMYLQGIKLQLEVLVVELVKIAAGLTKATQVGNFQLQVVLNCQMQNFSSMLKNLNEGLSPLNRLVNAYNLFIQQLVNLGLSFMSEALIPEISPMAIDASDVPVLNATIAGLDDAIELLTTVRMYVFQSVSVAMQQLPAGFSLVAVQDN